MMDTKRMNDTRRDKYNSYTSGEYADAHAREMEKRKRIDSKIKADDKKYSTLVIAIKNELLKRNIHISDSEFDSILDEIIEGVLEKPLIGKRYIGAKTVDIRNAVKRSINKEKSEEIR